jgi:hypothetical protein
MLHFWKCASSKRPTVIPFTTTIHTDNRRAARKESEEKKGGYYGTYIILRYDQIMQVMIQSRRAKTLDCFIQDLNIG